MLLSARSAVALLLLLASQAGASDEVVVQPAIAQVEPDAPPPISFHHHAVPRHITSRSSSRRAHVSDHVMLSDKNSARATGAEWKERGGGEKEGEEDGEGEGLSDSELELYFENFEGGLYETDEDAPEPLSQAEKDALAKELISRGGVASTSDDASPTASELERRSGHYIGHGTYYRAGYGACGWHNHGWEMVVALSHHHWKHGSHCGKHIKACHHGRCIRLRVVDKCMGCGFGSLDMTTAAFKRLAHLRQGVVGVGWRWD